MELTTLTTDLVALSRPPLAASSIVSSALMIMRQLKWKDIIMQYNPPWYNEGFPICRASYLVANLGWVDSDLGSSPAHCCRRGPRFDLSSQQKYQLNMKLGCWGFHQMHK